MEQKYYIHHTLIKIKILTCVHLSTAFHFPFHFITIFFSPFLLHSSITMDALCIDSKNFQVHPGLSLCIHIFGIQ